MALDSSTDIIAVAGQSYGTMEFSVFKMDHNSPCNLAELKNYGFINGFIHLGIYIKSENMLIGAFIK